jgi:hypothetical protein
MSKASRSTNPAVPETPAKGEHEGDVIVVPKGSSRARFIMTALLAMLVLTTFTVSGEVIDVLTGRNRAKNAYMTWRRSNGQVEDIKASDFLIIKQNLSKVQALLSGGRTSRDHDDSQTARHILADQLAQEAGIDVTDAEMAKTILAIFGSPDMYKRRLADYRTSALEFEQTLRSMLRVRRYEMLLAQSFTTPDPKDVEKQWKESHQEYSLDTIELPTERFAAEAAAACPAGDELKGWFDGLSETEKSTFRLQLEAKTSAEFSWFLLEHASSPERLLAKYPRPETENADDVARTWYEANKNLLYRKPGLPPGKTPAADDYLPFDEVKDRARAEGIVNQSMLDWLNGMKLREEKGEKIILQQEGSEMGLAYRQEVTPHTRAEWAGAMMAWSGKGAVESMFDPASGVGKILPDVNVDPKGLFVGRLLDRQESRMPAFEEVRDKVRDGWIKKKKGELALAKLEELRAKFSTGPDPADATSQLSVEADAAKFQGAAQELGLELKAQDWFDATARVKPGSATPFSQFLRRAAGRYGSTVGAIAKPEMSADHATAWLARVAGKRDPDPARMTPLEYQTVTQMASYESRNEFIQNNFLSDEFLKEHYGLELEAWRREDAEKSTGKK